MMSFDWRSKLRLNSACRAVLTYLEDGEPYTIYQIMQKVRIHNPRVTERHITVYISHLRVMLEPRGYSVLYSKFNEKGYYRLCRLISKEFSNSQE